MLNRAMIDRIIALVPCHDGSVGRSESAASKPTGEIERKLEEFLPDPNQRSMAGTTET
jgi:hypothetical protein